MIGKTISHYKILEKLGEGGMGVVYKAEDTKLKRQVVLKFLHPHLTADKESTERFEREAQAAAALNHPNIITVHEIGQHKNQSYIAMEYVKGHSLRDEINKGPLPIDKATNLATQICEGLNEAHQAGIVHRDIKPENILIDNSGRIKIVDFGLARMRGVTQLTKDASTLGTLKYMSPEQFQNKQVDHRTDIWSFGVILFEMLTGELPFEGDYDASLMYAVLNEEPKSIKTIPKDIPDKYSRIITKCLQKKPADRYQHIEKIITELKEHASIEAKALKWEKSIIVLPFENMSPDPEQEYFSDGLTEEIITDLSLIHKLLVISRSSAMTFKGTKKKIKEIAREVNVQYVLEGSVRKTGNNLRITAQLIDAANDAHLWAEKFSGTLDDVFNIQEKVSREIVDALKLKLTLKEDKYISERPIRDVQAYECYLRATTDIVKMTEGSINQALQYLQNAVDIIGDNAQLYSVMAFAYWNLVNIGVKHEDYIISAEEYANKALSLNPDTPLAHVILGYVDWNHQKMLESLPRFKRALENNPDEIFGLVPRHQRLVHCRSSF